MMSNGRKLYFDVMTSLGLALRGVGHGWAGTGVMESTTLKINSIQSSI